MENTSTRNFAIKLTGLDSTSKVDEFLYAKELENRVLWINDVVTDDVIDTVVSHIIRYNVEDEGTPVEDRKPITIYVNTDGGDAYVAVETISVIRASKTPVHTVNLRSISAGSLIFLAGHKRFSYRNTFILIHEGQSGYVNQTSKTKDHFKFQEQFEERIKAHVVSTTKIDGDLYDKKYKEEWYIFGDEALELGMVDELLD
jgi:ATP-dependent Clp protease protease subunit